MSDTYRIMVIGEDWHGSNVTGLARGFRELGHAVEQIGSNQFIPQTDGSLHTRIIRRMLTPLFAGKFNDYILRQLKIIQPDLVVVFKGNYVSPKTLHQVREQEIWLCNFYPDISFFSHKSVNNNTWQYYDIVFTTKQHGHREMEQKLGLHNVEFLQHGFDLSVHRPLNNILNLDKFISDVSFIGGWSPHKEIYISAVATMYRDINLKVWGDRWHNSRLLNIKPFVIGYPIFGDFYALSIFNSKINLGLLQDDKSCLGGLGDKVTSRTFHIPASGGFLLHERTDEVLQYYEEGKEIACFGSPEELLEKVNYYLQNERERFQIAKAGHERCVRENSLSIRAQAIIDRFESEKTITSKVRK